MTSGSEQAASNDAAASRTTTARVRRRRRGDRGVTFVEVLITIALIGIVVVPILSAVQVSIRSSAAARDAAQVETLLVNAIDRVNRANRGDYQCDLSGPPRAAVQTAGWSASQLVVVQEHLDPTTGNWVANACPGTPPNLTFQTGLVQRITLTLSHPDRPITRTLQVVKSDV